MRSLLLVAAGISVSFIVFASLPTTGPDAAGSSILHKVSWVNPDGSHGVAAEIVVIERREKDRRWIDPSGIQGTISERTVGQSLVKSYFWINPDGSKGMLAGSTDDHDDPSLMAVAARD